MNRRVVIVSMGCSKNLVDSERLAARLGASGIDVDFDSDDVDGADVVINTCGFIGDAKEESVNMLLNAIELKKLGRVRGVFVMGCLSERYRKELTEEMPELDAICGKFDWDCLVDILTPAKATLRPWERELSTAPHHAYVKISEGCNRFCAFCAIPLITGRHHSRPIEQIVAEVEDLVARGVKEFNIIAQDLSAYGTDLPDSGGRSQLAKLIETLSDIAGVEMIRLHYAYPADFPYDILPVMASRPNVCKYLDIALQHIDDKVLSNMRRHITSDETRALLARIRREVPGIHLRTTLMTGFPGEDDEAFGRLLDFVREQRFERMGAFAYCEEEDTYAQIHFDDEIPEHVKQQRLDLLMEAQHDITCACAEAKIGTVQRVIIDEQSGAVWLGRTEFDSPEVDCVVTVHSDEPLQIGNIYNVRITGADEFDLIGTAEL